VPATGAKRSHNNRSRLVVSAPPLGVLSGLVPFLVALTAQNDRHHVDLFLAGTGRLRPACLAQRVRLTPICPSARFPARSRAHSDHRQGGPPPATDSIAKIQQLLRLGILRLNEDHSGLNWKLRHSSI
jgi:hypothetical protein